MTAVVWVKIAARKKYNSWHTGQVQAYKTKPETADNEVAIKVILEIPDEVFNDPVYEVKVALPKITRQMPESTEIAKHVGDSLTKKLGFRVRIEMPQDPVVAT